VSQNEVSISAKFEDSGSISSSANVYFVSFDPVTLKWHRELRNYEYDRYVQHFKPGSAPTEGRTDRRLC